MVISYETGLDLRLTIRARSRRTSINISKKRVGAAKGDRVGAQHIAKNSRIARRLSVGRR